MSRTMTKSPGQNDSFDFSQEGNLYAVDSLNNLNKLNLCIDESQDLIHEDSTDEMPWSTMRGQCIFLLTLIIIAAVTCILILCIVGFFGTDWQEKKQWWWNNFLTVGVAISGTSLKS
ncbi:leucine-rich single-pass membrane protein 1 isoform X2 [Lissotriton helveticus]